MHWVQPEEMIPSPVLFLFHFSNETLLILHYNGYWIDDLLIVIAQGIFILNFNRNNTFSTVEIGVGVEVVIRGLTQLTLRTASWKLNLNKLWSKCIKKWILFYICKYTPHTCLLFLRLAFSKKRCIIIEANFSKLGMY